MMPSCKAPIKKKHPLCDKWAHVEWEASRGGVSSEQYLLSKQDARPPSHICGRTERSTEGLRIRQHDLKHATRHLSLSLLALQGCNRRRCINHFENHGSWQIGESWTNIYVGCKNFFPVEVFGSLWKHWWGVGATLSESDPSRNSACPLLMYCFSNTLLIQAREGNWT